jgi:hypothetical protein
MNCGRSARLLIWPTKQNQLRLFSGLGAGRDRYARDARNCFGRNDLSRAELFEVEHAQKPAACRALGRLELKHKSGSTNLVKSNAVCTFAPCAVLGSTWDEPWLLVR